MRPWRGRIQVELHELQSPGRLSASDGRRNGRRRDLSPAIRPHGGPCGAAVRRTVFGHLRPHPPPSSARHQVSGWRQGYRHTGFQAPDPGPGRQAHRGAQRRAHCGRREDYQDSGPRARANAVCTVVVLGRDYLPQGRGHGSRSTAGAGAGTTTRGGRSGPRCPGLRLLQHGSRYFSADLPSAAGMSGQPSLSRLGRGEEGPLPARIGVYVPRSLSPAASTAFVHSCERIIAITAPVGSACSTRRGVNTIRMGRSGHHASVLQVKGRPDEGRVREGVAPGRA